MKKKIKGSHDCPRLYIFKSNKHIYAQVIDDDNKKILTSNSTISEKINRFANCTTAKEIGQKIANNLKAKGIKRIIFDRGYNKYHGQIKALAEATRKEGITF